MGQIRLKKRPTKPSLVRSVDYHVKHGDSLKKLNELSPNGTFHSSYSALYYRYKVPETEEVIARKMKVYGKAIQEYNQWYEENREQIESQIMEEERIKEEKAALKKEMFELTRRTKEVREKINKLR